MTKYELVNELRQRVSRKLGKQVRKELIETTVEELLDLIVFKVFGGEEVKIRGFGKFYLKEASPRRARNPKTGEVVNVPPRKVFAFKPSKDIRFVEVK
ncbi:histone family protein DNA-binding protein [Thermovibrio ammonificans HB-1]|uniref:Histone family protein DNA-binding protein n=1 Tax=Thermovibrio ammonificans (strain DSM 15698 / JCM 12110 / HB-1) TaxID=648996 RepID=E8T307_THEA1|nr:HU family DNA-binding protein [Thermovibrio ammonificans]ADU96012.1 histone family protein DNA-binding protein [Thermovibrio ammonificans HB-1]